MKSYLAPQTIITLSALFLLCVTGLSVYLATSTPWLGLRLAAPVAGLGVQVLQVDPAGPSAGKIAAGEQLVAMGNPRIALEAGDMLEEPDALTTYAAYNAFMQRQSLLNHALEGPQLELRLEGGRDEVIAIGARRPVAALPWLFWYQIACGAIVFLAGVSVLAFRPRERVTIYYALTGLGLLLAAASAAVYSTRELAIDGDTLHLLSLLNQFGSLLFAGTFISILWYYPRPLHPFPFGPVFISGYLVCWLLNLFQVYETLDAGMRYPLFVGLALNLGMAYTQWRMSRSNPVHRAILKWFLMAWLSGTTVYLGLHTIPLLLKFETVISQSLGWGILVTVYLGVAFGITRYRLFNLDRWVVTGWFWFLGGVMVIAIDALLVSLLQFHDHLAMATALALAGWLYFPLRQRLWKKLPWNTRHSVDYQELLPDLLTTVLNTRPNALQQEWSQLLQQLFLPLNIGPVKSAPEQTLLQADGASLIIPGFNGINALELSYANRGSRLFNNEDRKLADAIHQLFAHVQDFRQAFSRGVQVERQRLARDLHDDVGARLLSLVYAANDEQQAELARETLQELRGVIRNLEHKHYSLGSALSEMRMESSRRCEERGVALHWSQPGDFAELALGTRQHSNLQRILREALSNALRHGQATRLQIELQLEAGEIRLKVSNDGVVVDSTNLPSAGNGMRNIRSRAEELGGSAEWHFGEGAQPGSCSVAITIPIQGEGNHE